MTALIIIAIVILILLAAIFAISNVLCNIVIRPRVWTTEEMISNMKKANVYTDELIDSFAFEEFSIKSRYGYTLLGSVINRKGKIPDKVKNVAVVCHGYTACRPCSYPYTDVFLKLGFTVVMYDHRNHGESDKAFTSMGYYEKYDLQTVLDWCYEKFGSDINVVTHGESMGAATVLNFLAIDKRPKCVIADCGYNSLPKLVKHLMKYHYHLPAAIFVPIAKRLVKHRAGFDIMEVKPEEGVFTTDTPILFIHGSNDNFVPTFMSVEMYNARKENSRLYLCEGAEHAESYRTNPAEYEKVVGEFLDEYFFDKK